MIKKFNLDIVESTTVDGIHWEYRPNREDILKKINEIIDVVNSIDERKDEDASHPFAESVMMGMDGEEND